MAVESILTFYYVEPSSRVHESDVIANGTFSSHSQLQFLTAAIDSLLSFHRHGSLALT